jgi:pilus assembly protein Flp/PilA
MAYILAALIESITTTIYANAQQIAIGTLNMKRTSGPVGPKEVVAVSLRSFVSTKSGQRGQGMVEYALILVLVSIVVIVILLTMGNQIANVFSNVVAALG